MNPYAEDRIGEPDWSEDQHVLYNWTVDAMFPLLTEKGFFATPDPSPLTVEQIETVFAAIAKSDRFTGQTVITYTTLTADKHVKAVTLNSDGSIEVETVTTQR